MEKTKNLFGKFLLNNRLICLIAVILFTVIGASGSQFLYFDNDYRTFFGKDNPQLSAFEELQQTYTQVDNVNFAFEPLQGLKATSPKLLAAVEELTEMSWQIPYSIRVDSLSNYQHTEVDEDDLIVRDLFFDPLKMSPAEKQLVETVSTTELSLAGRVHDPDHRSTSVNVTVQIPGKDPQELVDIASSAKEMASKIEEKYPVKIRMGGVVMLNAAFLEASMTDMSTLIPAAFFVILIISYILLRSMVGVLNVFLVCIFSIIFAMGCGGWIGVGLTPVAASAPIIIVTLAVADAIHLLVTTLNQMRSGKTQRESILYSLRVNFKPVLLTSVTTAIGFLSLNFSDSPPFHDLGNIAAIGVMAAWLYSITLIPILVSYLPLGKPKRTIKILDGFMERLGTLIADNYKKILVFGIPLSVLIVSLIPLNEINDDFVKYFDESTDFRKDTDWIGENLTGTNIIQFSIPSGESNGVSDPNFLKSVSNFTDWARSQKEVTNVLSISDVFKRLNRDLNLGNPDYYSIPDSRELAAQYLLLYELSLPFGLDLNNQLDINKSSTQILVTLEDMSTNELRAWTSKAENYINDKMKIELTAVGPTVMFAYISERNIEGMLTGTIIAIFIISGLILIALRDVRLGLISLIPNLLPAALAFGIWGLIVGQVNLAVSVVTGLALGIVVDDSVHFLTKYQLARRELKLKPREAVISAFTNVGTALVVTTLILVAGFFVLAQSSFGVNSITALLTAIAISLALIADLTLLPALLIALDKDKDQKAFDQDAIKGSRFDKPDNIAT
tara:strand:- start:1040 stop:3397 length:2358 start_codon:yes stop_codon:yes gene_type:complete